MIWNGLELPETTLGEELLDVPGNHKHRQGSEKRAEAAIESARLYIEKGL